ncbi:hypothetical protein [Bacteroides sp. 51]|uniref:hypothetical protein n=1 Tax=Bacteroides sp. 51 TaxID=2302938 RepID=UPI0013D5E33C|nr:hypothetical protein [Bacteroides sp. 51]NDV81230.1 hypothetical protein [Bacteroides sp. 51]
MNRTKFMLTVISMFLALTVSAQGDYIVTTASPKSETSAGDEAQFVVQNFPYYTICNLQAGQKFMLMVEDSYGIVSTFKSSATGRDVSNSKLQHKILEFQGTEEARKETYIGESVSTHFIFEVEGEKYYHEVKGKSLADVCGSNPRAAIHNLVFLGDVDIARELLMGKTLYTKVTKARVDEGGAGTGSREVSIARNLEVTVTAIGVGTRECPVKIVFEDRDGNKYFRNVMFSKTNAGLQDSELTGVNLEKPFANVFTFVDKEAITTEDIRAKYIRRLAYPKRTVEAKKESGGTQSLLRFTPLVVKDMTLGASTLATLKLEDQKGTNYTVDVNLKYDIFERNADYIDDMFGYGDLRKQYPSITEENWLLLGKGELKTGMTKDECMLALGSPIQIVAKPNTRTETWYYQGRTVEFDNGRVVRLR